MSRSLTGASAALTLPDGEPAVAAWALDPAVLHLNHGSYGAVPIAALSAQSLLRERMEADPVGWFISLPGRMAAARERLAPFLGIDAGRFALVTNASAGATAVFGSLPYRGGADVVVTDHGYGAVTLGAARLARRWGGGVRTASIPLDADADAALAAVAAELTPRTGLVVVDQITSPTARRLPVERIAALATERGIDVLIDGAHAPGMRDEPVPDAEAYWVGNLHKFACAPRGSAVLVPPASGRDSLYPVIDSWGAPLPFPERFDMQGTVDATAPLAADVAIRYLEETWGWSRIRDHARAVADHGSASIASAFAEATGEDHRVDVGMPVEQMRLIRLPGALARTPESAHRVRDRLKAEHGVASAPTSFGGSGFLRISAHAYSTTADYDEFVERIVPVLLEWARQGED